MPEGDTIHRSATTLQRWIGGRTVTSVRTTVAGLDVSPLVGREVEAVEAQGKHLLLRFGPAPGSAGSGKGPLTLHTHQRMNGAWHVYPAGARWRRGEHRARVVLDTGGRLAVCFDSPVVELFPTRETSVRPSLAGLGPDVLRGPIAPVVIWRRASLVLPEPGSTIGELLLDQRVVSGIGNIYRSEGLFACGVDPFTPWRELGEDQVARVVEAAANLMAANLGARHDGLRGFGDRRGPSVYGRGGRACPRCGTAVESARLGAQARTVWWCPGCQRRSRRSPASHDQQRWASSGPR